LTDNEQSRFTTRLESGAPERIEKGRPPRRAELAAGHLGREKAHLIPEGEVERRPVLRLPHRKTGKAHDANDRIIYDNDSGLLYYDADGTGAKAGVCFASISKGLKMTASDFYIV